MRRVIVAVVCVVCLAAPAGAYVLPVTDVAILVKNIIIRLQTELHSVLQEQQREVIQRMSRRVSEVIGNVRARYGIADDDPPRWRIHDFESGRFLSGQEYLAALNYGDPTGRAFTSITRPLVSSDSIPLDAPADSRAALRRAYATLDLADALGSDAAHQSGLVRYNGRSQISATNALDADALNDDTSESTTAVLDKLNASALIEVKQKQTRNELVVAIVELALLENLRRRNTEAVVMNQRLSHIAYYRSYSSSFFTEQAAASAAAWRQP